MEKILKQREHTLLFFSFSSFLVITISLFAFYPSFSLSLYGDSWLNLSWSVYGLLDFLHPVHISAIQHFFTQYGPFDTYMGIINRVAVFNPKPYFIIAFLLHTLAAFSLYPIAMYVTKKKTLAFLAVLFFSISSIGIGAIDWVFNAPVYLSTAFFSFFLFFFIASRQENRWLYMFYASFFFFVAYVFSPVRMSGLLPFALFLELFFLVTNISKTNFQKTLLRIVLLIIVFYLIRLTGSPGDQSIWTTRFLQGITYALHSLRQGDYVFLLNPFIIFGGMLYPDFILANYTETIDTPRVIILMTTVYLSFTIAVYVITPLLKPLRLHRKYLLPFGFILCVCIFMVHFTHPNTFSNRTNIISGAVGLLSFLFILTLLIAYRKNTKIYIGFLISLAWSFFVFLPPWWWIMDMPFQTYHRYLAPAGIGIALLLVSFISIAETKKTKVSLTILVCVFVFIPHIIADHEFFFQNSHEHGNTITDKIWTQIPPEGLGKDNKKRVFYFLISFFVLYNFFIKI